MATGVLVGRFQPITKAHYSIIKKLLSQYDDVFVVVVNSKASIAGNARRRSRILGKDLPKENDLDSWKKRRKENKLSKSYTYPRLEQEKSQNPFSGKYRKHLIYSALDGELDKSRILSHPLADIIEITKKITQVSNDDTFYFFAGSDRKQKYQPMIDTAYKKGQISNDIKIKIKEVKRDMDSVDNVSATKVRQAAIDNDISTFKELTPPGIHSEFEKMRKNLLTEKINIFRKTLTEMTHLEDLDVGEFIDFVKNIYKAEASIKLDGTAALSFGIDEKGFYSSFGRNFKEIKEENKKRSIDDWLKEESIFVNSAVSAHAALEKNMDKIKDALNVGDSVNAEIMFGDKPNVIKYDFKGVNHLVILNNDEFAEKIGGRVKITVPNYVITNEDELELKKVGQTWNIGKTSRVNPGEFTINIDQQLKELEGFLNDETDGIRNIDILSMRAAGKKKDMVKEVREKAKQLKLNVKQGLLNDFVRKVRGGEYSPSDEYSHEGIVLKKDDKMAKIIDKDEFTRIHHRDWQPAHDAQDIRKKVMKNQLDKEEALEKLNNMFRNFDKLYPNVSKDFKPRMLDTIKMTRKNIREQ